MKKLIWLLLIIHIGAFANTDDNIVNFENSTTEIAEEKSKVETILGEVDFAIEVEDYAYAEKILKQGMEEEKDNIILRNTLIRVYTLGGKYKESYNLIKKATILEVDKEKDEVTYDKTYGELFLYQVENIKKLIEAENLNWKKAIYQKELYSYYETYIEISGYQDSEAIYDLGNIYMSKGQFEKAMEIFGKDKGKDYRNIFGVAVTSRYLGYYQKAIDNYIDFINLKPEMHEAYLGLAQAYQMKGEYTKAITYFEKYLEYNKDERVYIVMANIEIARDRLASASGLLEEGQKYFPNSKEIEELLIEVYSKLGR